MSASSDEDNPINEENSEINNSEFNLTDEIEQMENQLIVEALKKNNGHLRSTANELGINIEYLKMKIKQHTLL